MLLGLRIKLLNSKICSSIPTDPPDDLMDCGAMVSQRHRTHRGVFRSKCLQDGMKFVRYAHKGHAIMCMQTEGLCPNIREGTFYSANWIEC